MAESIKDPDELQRLYARRFERRLAYRQRIWRILVSDHFQPMIPAGAAVLDLGCGYGEFINQVAARRKYGMDLNPHSRAVLHPDVGFFEQDCTKRWPLADSSLDVVFTSNFFEHLPDKGALRDTLREAARCLRPGGRLIALGPNIKHVPGAYWDFWDHFICLTEMSLAEAMESNGYRVVQSVSRFLPYTAVNTPEYPDVLIRLYLAIPPLWRLFGKQFLVVGEKL